jgi:hypothetical protein
MQVFLELVYILGKNIKLAKIHYMAMVCNNDFESTNVNTIKFKMARTKSKFHDVNNKTPKTAIHFGKSNNAVNNTPSKHNVPFMKPLMHSTSTTIVCVKKKRHVSKKKPHTMKRIKKGGTRQE